ncbi:hypothetical protein AeMF1_013511 [Aphanomyces euteiches]|nr:hypothetical protein AeMF1_013511 [Aphanomyces euteiches]
MHDEKLLANDGASTDFGNTDGFAICPGGALAGVELFEEPGPPKKTPSRDDSDRHDSAPRGSKEDRSSGKSDSKSVSADSSKPAGSTPTAKSPTKPAPTSSKTDTSKSKPSQDSGEHDFAGSDLNFGENSRRPKPAPEPSKSSSGAKGRSEADNPKTAKTALSESKKRPGDKPLPSSSKRQKSSKRDSTPTLKDMFGSDDSDDGTGSIFQSLKKVYEKVYKSKPWRRYWYATGPILPDLPYSKPRLPKDKKRRCLDPDVHDVYQGRQQSMGTLDLSSDSIGRRVVHPDPHGWGNRGVRESGSLFVPSPSVLATSVQEADQSSSHREANVRRGGHQLLEI